MSFSDSKVLQQLGFNEKNEWILYDEKSKKFFEYLAANVGDENILSTEEQKQYRSLQEEGLILEDDDLANELKALESHFPGILSVTAESVEELERELKFLEMDTEKRLERIVRMEETEKKQLMDIEIIEKAKLELGCQVETLTEECVKKSEALSDLQKSNQLMIAQLKDSYIQPQSPPFLMYQMPLNEFYQKCDQLLGLIKIFMKQFFDVTDTVEESYVDPMSNLSMIDAKKKIQEIANKKLHDALTIAGMKSIIQSIDSLKSQASGDVYKMRHLIDEIEAENERMEMQFEVTLKEAEMLVSRSVDHQVTALFHEYFKGKNTRVLERLDAVKSLNDLADDATLYCEMLWAHMQIDVEKLKNRVDTSDEFNNEIFSCTKRMRQLKAVELRDPEKSLNNMVLKKLQTLMSDNVSLDRDQLPTIAKCLQEYSRFIESVQKDEKLSIDQENLSLINESIKQIDNQAANLKKLVFNGPTSCPKLYDTKFLTQIFEKEQRKKEIEKAYEASKSSYKKIIEKWESDKFFVMERNLWIYFLFEPKKVLNCIREVQKKAAQVGGSSYKALNIHMPKPI